MVFQHAPTKETLGRLLLFLALGSCLGLAVNAFRPDGIPLKGDWSLEGRITDESGRNLIISLPEARSLFESGEAVFLDARSEGDFAAGHIRGAINLPWLEFDVHVDRVVPRLPEASVLIAYCDGETCDLSKELARTLIDMGFPRARVLVNGWSVWKDSGMPTAEGSQP